MNRRAPGCAAGSEAELHQTCGADPESLLVVQVKLAEEPADALVSADEKDAAVVRPADRTGPAVAAEAGCEADSAASGCPVGEPTFAAVKSEPGTSSAAAAEHVNEPRSSAVKPAGEAWFEAAVKSLGESCFAVAVVPVDEPCPASGQPGPQAATGPVGEEQVEEDLKCFEWRTAHCEGS